MRHVYAIYDVKAKLSQLLRLVKEGETVIISDRGKPQFEIVLYKQPKNLSDRIQDLTNRGLIQPATHAPLQPVADIKGAVDRFLLSREEEKIEGKK